MWKFRFLLLITLMMWNFFSFAQRFSTDKEKFVKEFQRALLEIGKGDYADLAKKKLPKSLLETNTFPAAYFTRMVTTLNDMDTKKLKVFPEMCFYVLDVYTFIESNQPKESFDAWHLTVDQNLEPKNLKKMEEFLTFSTDLLVDKVIGESNDYRWLYDSGSFVFENKSKLMVNFANVTLICQPKNFKAKEEEPTQANGTIQLYKTNGVYDPLTKKWEGRDGQLYWEKVGLSRKETSASVKKYSVVMKTAELKVDSVLLTTPYFTTPILGKLTDKADYNLRKDEREFPQFISYEKRLLIKNVYPNVDYEGAFFLQGSTFIGKGSTAEPARLLISRNKQLFMKVASAQINMTPEKITCSNAPAIVYLSTGDSIKHAGLSFSYDLDKKLVELRRTSTGSGQSPFFDSYHKLDIFVQKIAWKTDENELLFTYDFGTSQEQRVANFESINFLDSRLYDRLQGIESVHPLAAISSYCSKTNEYVMSDGKMATALGRSLDQVKPLLLELAIHGFITYDTDAKIITVNPKLDNYVKGRAGQKDFDNVSFSSDMRPKELKGYSPEEIKQNKNLQEIQERYKQLNEERRTLTYFAKWNLSTQDLEIQSIDLVNLSDAKNVVIFPKDNRLVVKKDRSVQFNGWINAGKLELNASSALYTYSTNSIAVQQSTESLFRVRPLKDTDGTKPIPIASRIKGIKGEIKVDDPSNRSGSNRKYADYPKMKVSDPSFVFYNDKQIVKGAYDSTRFYYTVKPFEIDSLLTFSEKAFRLSGDLTSAGIFPKIAEDLKLMPDYSLGFSTQSPTGGFPFYGTTSKYDNKIILSNNGLQGAGTIQFVQSTSISKAFTFLPDSAIGMVQFTNKPVETGIQFPDVKADGAMMTYFPKKSMLKVASTTKTELEFYNAEAKLKGEAIITEKGMTGNGLMSFVTATTLSKNYRFTRWNCDADTAGFQLKNSFAEAGEDPIAFKANNVNSHVSFKERKGEFISNAGVSRIDFPVNQYACEMDRFTWLLDKSELTMENSGGKKSAEENDLDLTGTNFYSLHPKQDSLRFNAPKAKYDLKQRSIFCEKVEFLPIADARIYPDSQKVVIRKNAFMEPFSNAKIVANAITKYHTFSKANVEIKARRSFTGLGEYPYYDKDSLLTTLTVQSIKVDSSFQTVAIGQVDQFAGFKLSKEFDFYGKFKISAASQTIFFDGATRLNHECEKFDRNWMSFASDIDPKNIQIPVASNMKNLEGNVISAGILWRNSPMVDSIALYPAFLSKQLYADDPILISADGFLQYNPTANEYQIGSKEKLVNRSEKGNFLALHLESCSLNGEGVLYLGFDYGDAKVDAVGVVNYNQSTGETSLNLTARINLPVDKGALQDVAARINAIENLKPMDFGPTTFEQALVQWTDRKTADKIKSDYTLKGEVKKLPEAMESTFTITGLRLSSFDNSSVQEKGLISTSSYASLVNIFEKPVMKIVPIRAFFQQAYSEASGDRFGLQLEFPGLDYYFDYEMKKKDGMLRIISSDDALTTAVTSIKEEKRKTRNFFYEASTQRVYLSKFLRLFE